MAMALASRRALHLQTSSRGISSTPHLGSLGRLWFDKIKTTLTGKIKTTLTGKKQDDSLTLLNYADAMDAARKARNSGEPPINAAALDKHSAVLRYLHTIDPTGEKLTSSDKISATKQCKCTIAVVEHALAKYTWSKDAQKKSEKIYLEGNPVPRTASEMQNLMGKTPLDVLRSNLAKSDHISRNAVCPCGSRKRYKRCCGAS